jgi:tRNA dimethylallyltransferase
MWDLGLVDEVRDLSPRMGRTASGALGYRQVLEALGGDEALAEDADAMALARQRTIEGTRRFARRQERRFRQDDRVQWVPAGAGVDAALDLLSR